MRYQKRTILALGLMMQFSGSYLTGMDRLEDIQVNAASQLKYTIAFELTEQKLPSIDDELGMQIFTKTLAGKTITLEVEPSDTIENINDNRLKTVVCINAYKADSMRKRLEF